MKRTPILSTSILSSPNGPRELFTIFAMVCAATTKVVHELEILSRNRSVERTILVSNILSRYPVSSQESASPRIAMEH
jgi:hypothetical protein